MATIRLTGTNVIRLINERRLTWDEIIGARLVWSGVGDGIINKVTPRKGYIPLIDITVAGSRERINADTLKQDDISVVITSHVVSLPESIQLSANNRITLVCLANSTKIGGRCVAGKQLINGKIGPWIRPVGNINGGPIFNPQYRNGDLVDVMDVIGLEAVKHVPYRGYQQENVLVKSSGWERVGRYRWDQLQELVDTPAPLWIGAGERSDRIGIDRVVELSSSLRLIKVTKLEISGLARDGRIKLRAKFRYGRTEYDLSITDPEFEAKHQLSDTDNVIAPKAYLCVSIGEPYIVPATGEKACFKLVATVITPDM